MSKLVPWLAERKVLRTLALVLPKKIRSRLWALAYDMYEDPIAQFFGQIELHHITEAIHSKFGERKLQILDLGCGHGRLSIPLARLGHNVVGIDTNAIALSRARMHAEHEGL